MTFLKKTVDAKRYVCVFRILPSQVAPWRYNDPCKLCNNVYSSTLARLVAVSIALSDIKGMQKGYMLYFYIQRARSVYMAT